MDKEEAIKYLRQLYPNGGHCRLDEQRIEAIGMAVKALQEEPASEQNLSNVERNVKNWKEEPVDKCKGCNNVKGCITCVDGDQWAHYKEPVSDDLLDTTQTITYNGEVYTRCYKDKLDSFACKYPMSVPKTSKRYAKYSDVDLTIAVKEGAKWQKEQDQSTIELAEDHAMLAGMNRMEEQIMNKAKSGIGDKDNYIKFEDDTWLDLDPTMKLKPAFDVKEGEKVKVLIIKEV